MPINHVFSLLTALVSLSLGAFIILKNTRNSVNLSFGAFTIFVAIWVMTNFMADISTTPEQATFWARMTLIGPAILPPILLFFSEVYPRQTKTIKPLRWLFLS